MTTLAPPIDPAVAHLAEQVNAWLQPLGEPPSGQNLEYEIEFLEFSQAAEGKPETQFSEAEPPVWADVISQAETLFGRSRDLRLAVPWARAVVSTHGLVALPEALRLLHGFLDSFWDSVYPELDPDDGDPFARTSLMSTLAALDGLLGDVRNSPMLRDRRLAMLRPRDVEVALGKQPARGEEEPLKLGQIQGLLSEHREAGLMVTSAVMAAQEQATALGRVMHDRFGIERSPDLKPLRVLLQDVLSVLPQPEPEPEPVDDALADGEAADVADGDESAQGAAPRRGRAGPMRIDTREDAVRAIQLVCDYLERCEPTNPAQFLLRRAQRLIDMNFLRLVREFAPDAMSEVARIMGVDPDVIRSED
jgi:type VI secretion system protein ImpA